MLSAVDEQGKVASAALYWSGWVALVVASALLLWSASELIWTLLPAPESAGSQRPASSRATETSQSLGVDVAELHLFGQPVSDDPPPAQDAPETALNLKLLGTFATEDPGGGLAIIADEQSRQESYRVGDTVPGNAELREVHPDRIVIERAGRLETLRLVREDTDSPRPRSPASSRRIGAPAAGNRQLDWQTAQNDSRIDPARLRQLGQQVRALPFIENGKPIGVRLMSGSNSAVLNRLGLRSSDIILSVNGIPLSEPSRQMELLELLNQQSQFQVSIRRNGRDMNLNIDASQIQTP